MVSAREVLAALQPAREPVMHGAAEHAGSVVFGLSPLWVATILFVAVYAIIMSEKVNRAIVALLGAGLVILSGVGDAARGDGRRRLRTRSACCSA